MASSERTPSDVDRIAEGWVDTLVELNPAVGTYIGRPTADDRLADYSPAGHERSIDAIRTTVQALRSAEPADDIDRITVADLGSELELELESHDARLHLRDLNVIASPAQEIREVFDLMPTGSRDDWERIATRLGDVPRAIDGYIATLRAGAAEGVVPAVRQVREVAAQAHRIARPDGFFGTFAADAKAGDDELAEPLRRELERAAADAASAYGTLAGFLEGELQPVAGERDGVGRDIYALRSRHFLGAVIDLDETYEWGIEELERMVAEQESIASEIVPGASVAEAIAFLDGDPARKLHGTDALQRWMQETSDRAVAELGETQFDIPAEIRPLAWARSGTPACGSRRGCRTASRRARPRPGRSSPASSAAARRCRAACGRGRRRGARSPRRRMPRAGSRRDRLLLGDHARELLDAPLVGLVEVDHGAEEVPRLQRVDLAADASRSPATGWSSPSRNSASEP